MATTLRFDAQRACCAAALFLATAVSAQTTTRAAEADAALAPVKITGRAPPTAAVAGFGDIPLSRAPLQASVYDAEQLQDAGVQRLSELARFDPAVSARTRSRSRPSARSSC